MPRPKGRSLFPGGLMSSWWTNQKTNARSFCCTCRDTFHVTRGVTRFEHRYFSARSFQSQGWAPRRERTKRGVIPGEPPPCFGAGGLIQSNTYIEGLAAA